MSWLLALSNALLGLWVRRRCAFTVGARTRMKWWELRGARDGQVRVGSDSIVNCRIDFDAPGGVVTIGDRCYVGASHLACHTGIHLANDVIVSWGVTIVDHDSHALEWGLRSRDVVDWARGVKRWEHVTIRPVNIGHKVWIGFGASILKGVTIGEGAVVGARSVITRDVPPNVVVAGNPARIVRQLDRQTPVEPAQ